MTDQNTQEQSDQSQGQGADGDAIEKVVADAVEKATSGLRRKNEELLGKLKGREQIDAELANWKSLGADPDKLKKIITAFESSEEAKLIADGKLDEVKSRWTEKANASWNAKEREYEAKLKEQTDLAANLSGKYAGLLIDEKVRSEMAKAGAIPEAIEDAVLRARMQFRLEGDDVLARDAKGNLLEGKTGALTIAEWVESMRGSAAHWFNKPVGGGNRQQSNGATAAGNWGGDKASREAAIAARIAQRKG